MWRNALFKFIKSSMAICLCEENLTISAQYAYFGGILFIYSKAMLSMDTFNSFMSTVVVKTCMMVFERSYS